MKAFCHFPSITRSPANKFLAVPDSVLLSAFNAIILWCRLPSVALKVSLSIFQSWQLSWISFCTIFGSLWPFEAMIEGLSYVQPLSFPHFSL